MWYYEIYSFYISQCHSLYKIYCVAQYAATQIRNFRQTLPFSISALVFFTYCVTQHTGPTALRPIRKGQSNNVKVTCLRTKAYVYVYGDNSAGCLSEDVKPKVLDWRWSADWTKKCHQRDANPHSADQKQSSSPVPLSSSRPRNSNIWTSV